jgi:hypothetical protein
MHDIVIENNIISGSALHGIWFGYAETGCYNITVRGNTVSNTVLESIYMGHFNYLSDTITGTVVENNTVINAGTGVEGDIDIKAGNAGAIVRYNTIYGTGTDHYSGGIVSFATQVQIYGNTIYSINAGDGSIHINADGDGAGTGKAIADILVYNNLIYTPVAGHGIAIYATASPGSITGLKLLNNTIVSSVSNGIHISASNGRTITVAEMHNNIVSESGGTYAVNTNSSSVVITAANNNLYYDSGTLTLAYQGVNKTFAQWQALGFDTAGVNSDPSLDANYRPQVGSPALDAASTQGEFTVDKNQETRSAPWTIGAYETVAGTGRPRLRGGRRVEFVAPIVLALGLLWAARRRAA